MSSCGQTSSSTQTAEASSLAGGVSLGGRGEAPCGCGGAGPSAERQEGGAEGPRPPTRAGRGSRAAGTTDTLGGEAGQAGAPSGPEAPPELMAAIGRRLWYLRYAVPRRVQFAERRLLTARGQSETVASVGSPIVLDDAGRPTIIEDEFPIHNVRSYCRTAWGRAVEGGGYEASTEVSFRRWGCPTPRSGIGTLPANDAASREQARSLIQAAVARILELDGRTGRGSVSTNGAAEYSGSVSAREPAACSGGEGNREARPPEKRPCSPAPGAGVLVRVRLRDSEPLARLVPSLRIAGSRDWGGLFVAAREERARCIRDRADARLRDADRLGRGRGRPSGGAHARLPERA